MPFNDRKGMDATFTRLEVEIDGEDLASLIDQNESFTYNKIVQRMLISDSDGSMPRLTLTLRNDGFRLAKFFIRARLMVVKIWISYLNQEENLTPIRRFLGTFYIDKPKFTYPTGQYPTITLDGFGPEILLHRTERNRVYKEMDDDEIVKEIAEHHGMSYIISYPRVSGDSDMSFGGGGKFIEALQGFQAGMTNVAEHVAGEAAEASEGTALEGFANEAENVLTNILSGNFGGQTTQIDSDYNFIKKLAERNGYKFFVNPSPDSDNNGQLFFGPMNDDYMNRLGFERQPIELEYKRNVSKVVIEPDMLLAGLNVVIEATDAKEGGGNGESGLPTLQQLREYICGMWTALSQGVQEDEVNVIENLFPTGMPREMAWDIADRIRIETKSSDLPTIFIRQYGQQQEDIRIAETYRDALTRRGLWFVRGSVTMVTGNVFARARTFVTLSGVESHFNVPYYVNEIQHRWQNGHFRQTMAISTYMLGGIEYDIEPGMEIENPEDVTISGGGDPELLEALDATTRLRERGIHRRDE
jgi:hypothetical protein